MRLICYYDDTSEYKTHIYDADTLKKSRDNIIIIMN